ncbi:Nucleotidylyl transferase [Aureobasidium pullulans]|uniref:Nucleotidylyl transferase n=2 Tax=Aureobasidium pullulans TaxID=5580 RepID=A0AB74J732_AURPU|nr:Nucleotidylyl transferase [Aureobasidium pullulans]
MSTTTSSMRTILPHLESALKSFQSSESKFRIVRSINPSASSPSSPKTLFILDSSFNPPSKAHLALAKSALHSSSTKQHQSPFRLLLLFSTHNADKAPSAASFPQRLALMTIFAEDLLKDLQSSVSHGDYVLPTVDIGLTTAPYYTDKSLAISKEGIEHYPDSPKHVHLLGFDTITRFFAAKYYPNFSPPLSALNPYFDEGHQLRVTLRPSDEYGTVKSQQEFVDQLARGDMEADGGRREWASQIEVVHAEEGVGVSSTKVRTAAKKQDWAEVQHLCTEGVGRAVMDNTIYENDDRGAKMA